MTTEASSSAPAIWYDVTTLTSYAGPVTGIPRVVAEIARALLEMSVRRPVRFCRLEKRVGFLELSASQVAEVLSTRASEPWRRRSVWRRVSRSMRGRLGGAPRAPFASGDVLLSPGGTSYKRQQRELLSELLETTGVRFVSVVHDMLIALFSEWYEVDKQVADAEWLDFIGCRAAAILCFSEATARDLRSFLGRSRREMPRILRVRLGDDLPPPRAAGPPSHGRSRPYVLFVSSFEARKNHRLLFQIWRRLLAEHDPSAVPDLVFVGGRRSKRPLVDDFLAELRNSGSLGGRIVSRHHVSDEELDRLYAQCLFTVYPSIYEGWGLPVGESLAHGKYCVASAASSLPEIGGDLIDYHDPFDVPRAFELISRAIFDREFLAAMEEKIRARYRPVSWRSCAEAILRELDPLLAEAGPKGSAAQQ